MANTTFLLGAGASIGCLPVVTQINERLQYYIDEYLSELRRQFGSIIIPGSNGDSAGNMIDRIGNALLWLIGELKNTATFDTLAKTYLIQNRHQDLDKLKALISIFFLLEQVRNAPDIRVAPELENGAIIVIDKKKARARILPINQ